MGLFDKKICYQCLAYEQEIDSHISQNKRLKTALVELKKRYDDSLVTEEVILNISSAEIDLFFQKIKSSSYDKDLKRYLRSIVMVIKTSYDPSLYDFLKSKLD